MTCQHCQTWILDDDHRCRRCGRRVRNTPSRVSPQTFPIAATATAPDYRQEFAESETAIDSSPVTRTSEVAGTLESGQRTLFPGLKRNDRVIPFDSLTTPSERDSIRMRAAQAARPAPLKTEKVEVPRPRRHKSTQKHTTQHRFDFEQEEVAALPETAIICDAPVAPRGLRFKAALIDGTLMCLGTLLCLAVPGFEGGGIEIGKHTLPFLVIGLSVTPFFYKLLWVLAGRDTVGTSAVGLRLVDFDGNPPSSRRRYYRLLGSILSVLAGGIGVIWSLVDEDQLTWHDHISGTFPTLAADR